ncbi:hypothetical protein GZH47_30245 [Paenibacillus rhizovicinus]|uniref:Uncharacterized protein n=1 Tax=Paenibacillus rhizovicinus TaxID=2704463 RepID=A0A6C0PAI0_9BACL|nr:hypothetical protein [Paenibacillus rhizovicinus]QHW34653.1 hypothetical protein GZH47_30245 [Paenibacillus rhizovicinus]
MLARLQAVRMGPLMLTELPMPAGMRMLSIRMASFELLATRTGLPVSQVPPKG